MVILIKREFNTCGVSEAFMFYHYEELVAQLLYETEYETPFIVLLKSRLYNHYLKR